MEECGAGGSGEFMEPIAYNKLSVKDNKEMK